MPREAGMFCTIDGETFFYSFKKNTWIGNSDALCHISNDNTCHYDVTNINKLVQGSSGNMSTTKKGKLLMKACQVDGIKKLHILWCTKYCAKASANISSFTC